MTMTDAGVGYTLLNGKAQDLLPGEYAGAVSLVLTSPPYDDLRTFGGYMAAWDFDAVANAIVPCLAPGGVLVWVVADQVIDGGETLTSFRQALAFQQMGLLAHQMMVYEATGVSRPMTRRYPRTTQYMFVFSQGRPATLNRIEDMPNRYLNTPAHGTIRQRDGSLRHLRKGNRSYPTLPRGSVWRYDPGYRKCHPGEGALPHEHPATFPYLLAADHIRTWTNPGDIVLDPMAGSGTTLRAAANLGRHGVGVEVNPDYCDIVRRRMAQQVLLTDAPAPALDEGEYNDAA